MALSRAARENIDTINLYLWEDACILTGKRLTLQAAEVLVKRVWRYARLYMRNTRAESKPEPRVVFADKHTIVRRGGYNYYHYDQSYCKWPEGDIVLMPLDRCRRVLIHELTHALGYGTHGRAFCETYAQLLFEFL